MSSTVELYFHCNVWVVVAVVVVCMVKAYPGKSVL